MSTPSEVLATLKAMRELLTPKGAWRQGSSYGLRLPSGRVVEPHRPDEANCWCLWGALKKVAGPASPYKQPRMLEEVRSALWPTEFVAFAAWNDAPGRTQAEALQLLDDGIARTEASS